MAEENVQKKVSVVMPVYNVEKYLDRALADVTGQTLQEIEIICVDDGSTDGSRDIIRKWMKQDDRIQLIEQSNQFAGVARNNGLKYASGKYVVFWDSDDMFESEALDILYDQAEREQTDICICAARRYDNEKKIYCETSFYLNIDLLNANLSPGKKVFNKFDLPKYIFNLATNVPWNKLYRRDFILRNGLEFQNLPQANDTYFTMMAFFLADRISYVENVLITYRMNNRDSLSGKASDTTLCAYQSYLYTKKRMEQYEEYNLVRQSFINRVLKGFLHSLNIQTSFHSYEKLYYILVEEGFHEFGLTECEEKDFYFSWMYRDMWDMMHMFAADFLLKKSNERRLRADRLKAENALLKREKKELENLHKVNADKALQKKEQDSRNNRNQKVDSSLSQWTSQPGDSAMGSTFMDKVKDLLMPVKRVISGLQMERRQNKEFL